jgi:phosphoserine aminotransferase
MSDNIAPKIKPKNPNFSSGPCSKRPGYRVDQLQLDTLGRSHRSDVGKKALKRACLDTARILGLPEGYRVGVVAGSDTGAMEMAMWSMLGERAVDVFSWESFSKGWLNDIVKQLKLSNVNSYEADYGKLPDLSKASPENDCVFAWNGTTSGVKVPDGNWISDQRTGLTFCDATSAVFAMQMPWERLDVITFSWQKVLGGEGAHGMLILSPRAVERLESYTPSWPMPKIFRMTKNNKLIESIFAGATINTPSMLCVADYLDALDWVDGLGGVDACIERSQENLAVIEAFVQDNDWIHFLADKAEERSNTSVCLTLDLAESKVKEMTKLLASVDVAYDIDAYRDAPAGLRIWCGSTVNSDDLQNLMPWIEWAYQKLK